MTNERKPTIRIDVEDLFKGLAGAAAASAKTIEGSGTTVRESRELGHFERLVIRAPVELELVNEKEAPFLELEGDDNVLPLVHTEIADHTLSITLRAPEGEGGVSLALSRPISARLGHPRLTALETHGRCRLRQSSATLQGPSLSLELHGSTLAALDLDVDQLESELHGSCRVELTGQATQHQLRSLGSVRLDASQLVTRVAAIRLSGSTRVHVRVSERVDARLSGRSTLKLSGEPKVHKRLSGKARILRGD